MGVLYEPTRSSHSWFEIGAGAALVVARAVVASVVAVSRTVVEASAMGRPSIVEMVTETVSETSVSAVKVNGRVVVGSATSIEVVAVSRLLTPHLY